MAWDEPYAEGKSPTDGDKADLLEKPDPDRQLLLELARTFAKAPKHTADSLRTDRDLLLRVVREHREGWKLMKQATPQLKADRDVLLATIKGSVMGWRAMAFAAPELREDRDLCLEAVRRNAAAIELLSPRLRQDRELVSEALASISRRLQAPPPKAAVQDWDRLTASGNVGDRRTPRAPIGAGGAAAANGDAPGTTPAANEGQPAEGVAVEQDEDWAEQLRQEVESGLCVMHLDSQGYQTRVVPLMCIRVQQPNGLILAVLGKVDVNWSGSLETRARCMLPGTRILEGEQPRDSLNRFLQTTLSPLQRGLEVESDFTVHVEEGRSLKYGLRTKYLRRIYNASMDGKLQWKQVAQRLGMAQVRSPRTAPQAHSLGRRFCTGTAGYSAPLPPEMYILLSRPNEYGYSHVNSQLPKVNKSVSLYAWIPVWEYEWLRESETGRATLKNWLSKIHLHAGSLSLASPRSSVRGLPGGVGRTAQLDDPNDSDNSRSGSTVGGVSGTDSIPILPPIVTPRRTG